MFDEALLLEAVGASSGAHPTNIKQQTASRLKMFEVVFIFSSVQILICSWFVLKLAKFYDSKPVETRLGIGFLIGFHIGILNKDSQRSSLD
jgi:Na+/melibiose symporter-like transporter